MSVQAGIIGLPNVGKSTLFNSLSHAKAQAANFPFCTIEPNLGTILVPDKHLEQLAEIVKPEKIVPTSIEIYDIAGLVKGASKGEGLGNQFLSHIRNVNTIVHVVRCFEDSEIIHVNQKVDPISDKEIIDMELQLKDLESIEKKIQKQEKVFKSNPKESSEILDALNIAKQHISEGGNLRDLEIKEETKIHFSDLLTSKPVIYLCNVDDKSVVNGNQFSKDFIDSVKHEGNPVIILSSQLESEITALESYDDKKMFLEEYGLEEVGSAKLIRAVYKALGLITFYTAGKKEVRAWTVKKDSKAPAAAGVIHSDFEKGFIRAEVIAFDDFIELGSELACKENGKLAIQGKDYIVKEKDIVHFRFNV